MMEKYRFESGDGIKLVGILSTPKDEKGGPLVVSCHGLLSNKNSDKYVELSERFLERRVSTFRFDFRGCGESEGSIGGPVLSDRLTDLESALDLMAEEGYGGPIGLFGSSFGGIVAILEAAKRGKEIQRLAVWATPSRLGELFSDLVRSPDLEAIGGPPSSDEFLSDVKNWNFLENASRVSGGLVVHGGSDSVVPPDHADTLYDHLLEPKRKLILKEGDHVISGRKHRNKAMSATVDWICKGFEGKDYLYHRSD